MPTMNNALLVIDIQDSFKISPARWASRNNPRFEENVTELIARFRDAGRPVIFVLHNDSDPGFRPGDPEVRLMSFLDRRESEPLIVKNTRNAFTSTDLQARLDALGVRARGRLRHLDRAMLRDDDARRRGPRIRSRFRHRGDGDVSDRNAVDGRDRRAHRGRAARAVRAHRVRVGGVLVSAT